MIDYNLGEKYADRFVSVKNEPLYDFNEFSYFGRDLLWEPSAERDLYSQLYDALDWVRNTQQSNKKTDTPLNSNPELPAETSAETSTVNASPESPSESPMIQINKPTYISHIGNFNVDKAIERLHYLTQFKLDDRYDTSKWTKKDTHSSGTWCARAVSLAMEAGGLKTNWRPDYAGNYGERMVRNGWQQLADDTTNFQKGDVCVIKGLGTKGKGHISMFDGKQWVSDFYQNSWDVYRGRAKRGVNTHFYRYKG